MCWVIELCRTYRDEMTTGRIFINDVEICRSIELPWRHNMRNKSCIPEGQYRIKLRHTEKFGDHMLVEDVPGRKFILIHPANYAQKELRGCIAPVMELHGDKGLYSRVALNLLLRNIRKSGIHLCQLKISSE